MKTNIMIVIASGLFLSLTACSHTNDTLKDKQDIADQLNPNRELRAPAEDGFTDKLGFVRYSAEEINEQVNDDHNLTIDRQQMADIITRTILKTDGFKQVATLVTDQEVLIAYDRNGEIEMEADSAADIARKTAISMMPGFYDVYVSDNKSLMYDIQSLHNSSTDRNYDNMIKNIIIEMKKTQR